MTQPKTGAAEAVDVPVVLAPLGSIAFMTEAEAAELSPEQGRRATEIDLMIAGVAHRS